MKLGPVTKEKHRNVEKFDDDVMSVIYDVIAFFQQASMADL